MRRVATVLALLIFVVGARGQDPHSIVTHGWMETEQARQDSITLAKADSISQVRARAIVSDSLSGFLVAHPPGATDTSNISARINYRTAHQSFYYRVGVWIGNSENSTAVTTQANTANVLRAFPFYIARGIVVDSLRYIVSTAAAGAMTIAIYNDSTASYPNARPYPMTQLVLGGRDTTSASAKTISNTAAPDTLRTGLYWVAYNSTGTATVRAIAQGAILNILGYAVALGANNQNVGLTIARTYDQFFPAIFPASATVLANANPPQVIMRVSAVLP